MAKTAEEANAIRFALGTACKDWVTVPVSLIDRVEPLRHVPCDDHAHPFVQLVLKDTGTPECAVLTSLLRAAQQQTSPCEHSPQHRREPGPAQQPVSIHTSPPAQRGPGRAAGPQGAAGVPAQPACRDGDTSCHADGTCWGCCAGDWFDIGRCVYGMSYTCNNVPYNAYSCWPIS
ncbi:hypothetical protein ACFQ2B_01210 [Streptomyces stramineus]